MLLLPTLLPNAPDLSDAVVIGDDHLSREDLIGAATAVAERIRGAHTVAVPVSYTHLTLPTSRLV